MLRVLIRNWWLLALRGILALVFAVLAFALQPLTDSFVMQPIVYVGIVVVFGVLALAAGVSTIAAAIRGAAGEKFHLLLWDGVAVCLAGIIVLLVPWIDLRFLARLVGAWAVAAGIIEIFAAQRLRRHLSDEWSLVLTGLASFGFGVFLLYSHDSSELTLFNWLALYATLSGFAVLVLALRLRSLRESLHQLVKHAGA